ncbi:hypothetical protein [Streptomyces sp. NPDC003077]|uniref:hypothetical protein n=1 Tax=Streptomyces sp. NPDC003077 TaxID=3154443 RepID=UPI0033B6890E
MTDTTDTANTANTTVATGTSEKQEKAVSEGTWAIPLLLVIPVVLIRTLTDLSTFWRAAAWVAWSLGVALVMVGWLQFFRKRGQETSGWTTCWLAHALLATQAYHLITD